MSSRSATFYDGVGLLFFVRVNCFDSLARPPAAAQTPLIFAGCGAGGAGAGARALKLEPPAGYVGNYEYS